MHKFQMPGLSKYWCYEDGSVFSDIYSITDKGDHYILIDDMYNIDNVDKSEIMHYGKHLREVRQYYINKYLKID